MASESSSAVLDLNDPDTDDTEPPSVVTDDLRDGPPLIMEHGYDIAVRVDAPMKQLSTLETFVTYRVRCVCARWPAPAAVRRRYNHFKWLHKRLSSRWPLVAAPPLPPLHSARQHLDRYAPAFVRSRTAALHAFINRVVKHPIFTHSDELRLFLTTPDDEADKVFKSDNNAMNLWGLSSALYGTGESKPTSGPRVKDPEWIAHADYLQSLQHKLSALCSLTNKLYKGQASLSNEMNNMKRVCDAWSVSAGGQCGRAAAALTHAAHAHTHAHTHAHRQTDRLTDRLTDRQPAAAALAELAAYTDAHRAKIAQRDAIHAAYVAGTNSSSDLHNKLEQASEALRSELSDWLPKTKSEIKSILLEIAETQVAYHTQCFTAWDRAIRLSNDANIDQLFKTVSKTAVQNLSPSKCRSESSATERDLDFESDSDSCGKSIFNSSEVNEKSDFERINDERVNEVSELVTEGKSSNKERMNDNERVNEKGVQSIERMNDGKVSNKEQMNKRIVSNELMSEGNDSNERMNESNELRNERVNEGIELMNESIQSIDNNEILFENQSKSDSKDRELILNENPNITTEDCLKSNLESTEGNLGSNKIDKSLINDTIVVNTVEKSASELNEPIKDSNTSENGPKSVESDPLRQFSDVDLS